MSTETVGRGFFDFTKNNDGSSCLAVKAPIERVAAFLAGDPDVLEHEADVDAEGLETATGLSPEPGLRRCYLLQLEGSAWTLLVRTVHWCRPEDVRAVESLAERLSAALSADAVSCADDDFASPTYRLFRDGRPDLVASEYESMSSPSYDYDAALAALGRYFDEEGLYAPRCFISVEDETSALHLDEEAARPVRVDRLVFRVSAREEAGARALAAELAEARNMFGRAASGEGVATTDLDAFLQAATDAAKRAFGITTAAAEPKRAALEARAPEEIAEEAEPAAEVKRGMERAQAKKPAPKKTAAKRKTAAKQSTAAKTKAPTKRTAAKTKTSTRKTAAKTKAATKKKTAAKTKAPKRKPTAEKKPAAKTKRPASKSRARR